MSAVNTFYGHMGFKYSDKTNVILMSFILYRDIEAYGNYRQKVVKDIAWSNDINICTIQTFNFVLDFLYSIQKGLIEECNVKNIILVCKNKKFVEWLSNMSNIPSKYINYMTRVLYDIHDNVIDFDLSCSSDVVEKATQICIENRATAYEKRPILDLNNIKDINLTNVCELLSLQNKDLNVIQTEDIIKNYNNLVG